MTPDDRRVLGELVEAGAELQRAEKSMPLKPPAEDFHAGHESALTYHFHYGILADATVKFHNAAIQARPALSALLAKHDAMEKALTAAEARAANADKLLSRTLSGEGHLSPKLDELWHAIRAHLEGGKG